MTPKFRAWHIQNAEMIDVGEMDFILQSIYYMNANISFDEFYIMQSTGKYDETNQEVFLNDIVEDEYGHRYEVVFEGDCLRCNGVRRIRGGHKPKNRWFGIDLEIIGNRFENPELLKEQNK